MLHSYWPWHSMATNTSPLLQIQWLCWSGSCLSAHSRLPLQGFQAAQIFSHCGMCEWVSWGGILCMVKCIHITFSRVQDLGHSISGINQPPPRRSELFDQCTYTLCIWCEIKVHKLTVQVGTLPANQTSRLWCLLNHYTAGIASHEIELNKMWNEDGKMWNRDLTY